MTLPHHLNRIAGYRYLSPEDSEALMDAVDELDVVRRDALLGTLDEPGHANIDPAIRSQLDRIEDMLVRLLDGANPPPQP